jgi:hypothetical protein
MARKENFPTVYAQALTALEEKGELILSFPTADDCTRERLKFYRFLSTVRENSGNPGYEVACKVTVQLKHLPGEKAKRILRLTLPSTDAAEVWNNAAAGVVDEKVREELEIEDLMAKLRAKGGKE